MTPEDCASANGHSGASIDMISMLAKYLDHGNGAVPEDTTGRAGEAYSVQGTACIAWLPDGSFVGARAAVPAAPL